MRECRETAECGWHPRERVRREQGGKAERRVEAVLHRVVLSLSLAAPAPCVPAVRRASRERDYEPWEHDRCLSACWEVTGERWCDVYTRARGREGRRVSGVCVCAARVSF